MSRHLLVILIRSLDRGGAETQVANLAYGLRKKSVWLKVVVFYGGGHHESALTDHGI